MTEDNKDVQKVSAEDLNKIMVARFKVKLAIKQSEKAALEARLMDMEYRSVVQYIFMRYGLDQSYRIDDETGIITKIQPQPSVEPSEAVIESSKEDTNE